MTETGPSPIFVVGIDPGTRLCGFATLRINSEPGFHPAPGQVSLADIRDSTDVIKLPDRKELALRLAELYDEIEGRLSHILPRVPVTAIVI